MEYPDLGKHCSVQICKRLDFLPIKCDACDQVFCANHMTYAKHNCPLAYKKNIQVPICPLCNSPVPTERGTLPDIAVGNHIDNACRSDQAKERKKVFINKCSMRGCKIKEIVPVICAECRLNYCFKHRHIVDHNCSGMRQKTFDAAVLRKKQNKQECVVDVVQGNLSEDEALAKALQLSLEEVGNNASNSIRQRQQHQQQNCHVS